MSDEQLSAKPDDDEGTVVEEEAEQTPDVEEFEDGTALVHDDDEPESSDDFLQNLAGGVVPDDECQTIAKNLLDLIQRDKDARAERDKKYTEGLKRTGLGDEAPGGADFPGASRVVHPAMAEACVDFEARAIKEICPPGGLVKTKLVGEVTQEKIKRANRKREHMNLQLTQQVQEYRDELEKCLIQVPLGGCQYMKWYWDLQKKRPVVEWVRIDDMLVPYSAASFYTAQRQTHRQTLTEMVVRDRINSGMYRDLDLGSAPSTPDVGDAQGAENKIEGKTQPAENDDGERVVHEVYTWLEIDGDQESGGELAPYIVTVDENEKNILAIYRNWMQSDKLKQKLDWIVEFPFIRWDGAQAIGLPHLIGTLSGAITGALRALLDSAHLNNISTGYILKGARVTGQSKTPQAGTLQELESAIPTDDINKLIKTNVFNPPSGVLFQLLGFLVQAAKGVVSTAEEQITDANNNGPVGTTLALIEQGSIVFSSIHARLHEAQARSLQILHRLNGQYLDDAATERQFGSLVASREDYDCPCDIIPVSDPHIFSESQRFAQAQAVHQLATNAPPGMYNRYEAELFLLQRLKIDDHYITRLLPPQSEPEPMDPASENVAVMMGKPIDVHDGEDNLAHIETHTRFIADPYLGGNPIAAPVVLPKMIPHLLKHVAKFYMDQTLQTVDAAAGQNISEIEVDENPALLVPFSQVIARASPHVHEAIHKLLDTPLVDAVSGPTMQGQPQQPLTIMQIIAAAAQTLKALTPPPPDAQMVAAQAMAQKNVVQAQKNRQDLAEKSAELQTKQTIAVMDNTTAANIAAAKVATGGKTQLSDGASLSGPKTIQ